MADCNVKNYTEQGGENTVIGGSIDIVTGGKLKIAGTVVTATAAELNKLHGVTVTTAEINSVKDKANTTLVVMKADKSDVNTTFTTSDGKVVTVENGVIVSIV